MCSILNPTTATALCAVSYLILHFEQPTCVCGKPLSKIQDTLNAYPGNHDRRGAMCNKCGESDKQGIIFWQCKDNNIHPHYDGYDICNECIQFRDQKAPICEQKHITNCQIYKRLMQHLQNDCDGNDEVDDSTNILDDYHHIIHNHHDDEQVEYIATKLSNCDFTVCDKSRYIRNNRDRHKHDPLSNYRRQIYDKIHCYFYHHITNMENIDD
eukprot:258585_1